MSVNGIVSKEHRREFKSRFPEIMPTAYPAYIQICNEKTYRDANLYLLRLSEKLNIHGLDLTCTDDQLTDWCDSKANHMKKTCEKASSQEHKLALCQREVDKFELTLPETNHPTSSAPIINRLCDAKWWRRKIRNLQFRLLDQIARASEIVNRKQQIYLSDDVHNRKQSQQRRNRKYLEANIAENEFGEQFSLAELSDASVSKPENRRCELMVRIRGFEEYAKANGHAARFFTLTCPSRFHTRSGFEKNKNYDGASVSAAQEYLRIVWKRARAQLGRENIERYGFRVVEPHHDGCPHWHILLWFKNEEKAEQATKIISHYNLQDSPEEAGAQEHRFTSITIDSSKGTATGYIAKYISKNIDGYGVDADLYGHDAKNSAKRIASWASTYGIRQFQQIGGASVTVWRELRRLGNDQDGELGELVKAADSADWCAFNTLMGGGFVKRNDQKIKIAYWLEYDNETGEEIDSPYSEYGDISKGRIFGVFYNDSYVLTREYRWTIKRQVKGNDIEAVSLEAMIEADIRLINEEVIAIQEADKQKLKPEFLFADGMRLQDFLSEQRSPLDLCQ